MTGLKDWLSTWGVVVNLVGVAIGVGVVIERQSNATARVEEKLAEYKEATSEQIGQISGQITELRRGTTQGREDVVRMQAGIDAMKDSLAKLERFMETQTIVNQTTMRDIARLESRR